MRWFTDYPPNTYIKCVLVGGEGHGQNWLKTPADAHGFKLMKRTALPVRFVMAHESDLDIDIHTETIHYDLIAEFATRNYDFVRVYAPEDYPRNPVSFLQIADALRIAGIDSL